VYLLLLESSVWSFLAVFILPGLVFGLVTGIVSLRAQQVLREDGRVDFLVAGFIGMCFPPLGSMLLLAPVGRLNAAAAREGVDSAMSQPPPPVPPRAGNVGSANR